MYNIGDVIPFKGKLYRIVQKEDGTCMGCSLFNHNGNTSRCQGINHLVQNRCSKKNICRNKRYEKIRFTDRNGCEN